MASGCDGGEGGGGGGDDEGGVKVPWLVARAAPDARQLRIGYTSDPCTRAREARVEESDEEVHVTLIDTRRDPRRACIQIVKPGCVVVSLDEPLGRRRITGGERGRGSFTRFGRCRPIPSR